MENMSHKRPLSMPTPPRMRQYVDEPATPEQKKLLYQLDLPEWSRSSIDLLTKRSASYVIDETLRKRRYGDFDRYREPEKLEPLPPPSTNWRDDFAWGESLAGND